MIFDSKKLFKNRHKLTLEKYKYIKDYILNDLLKIINNISKEKFKTENNKILKILESYFDETYINDKILDEWIHIWNQDFELDNYTNEELTKTINQVCNLNIKPKEIQNLHY